MKRQILLLNCSKRILHLGFFTGLLSLVISCQPRDRFTEVRNIWSASETQSVPVRIRKNQIVKENLVINSSFEEGKYFLEMSDDQATTIKGWAKVGSSVEWVDLEVDHFNQNEVKSGRHSVKISRTHVDETDETGVGIMSDFIRVIPGNYLFTYDIKLQNILPGLDRRGTRLYDAVNVRVYFYDNNKVPIKGDQYYPYKEIYLDATFKGYSFSNFWQIDSLGWGKIRGRTYNYPFSEGDVPNGTFYVRLFFGLKGTGTMWLDNVDFRYSKWNFTALERMEPYFDSTFSPSSMLIPAPKKVTITKPVPLFRETSSGYVSPLVIIPPFAGRQTLLAAKLLKKQIYQRKSVLPEGSEISEVRIIPKGMPPDDFKGLIFSIGQTDLFKKWKDSLAFHEISDNPQGYIIEPSPESSSIVFLAGSKPLGDYYATTTVIQLLDKDTNRFYSVSVVDYPDFTGRSYLFASWQNEEQMEEDVSSILPMSLLKFNKAYVGYGQTRGRKNWYKPDDLYKDGVQKAGRKCRESGVVDLAIMVNPYYHFNYEMLVDTISPDLRYQFVHSDQHSIIKLKSVFKLGLDAGAKTIMLMADDFVPHEGNNRKNYVLYTPEDKKQFINLQNAQAFMINDIYKWVSTYYPGTRFEFCPPWYLNEFIDRSQGRAEAYFRDIVLMIPQDVAIIWTGHTVRSLSYDLADIERYRSLIGRNPMIWDNTLYARGLEGIYGGYPAYYPGKIRLCNLFEPYDVMVPENFQNYVDGPHMYMNGAAFSEIYKIKYATVADFEWNTNNYDPEFSLWKSLVNRFGSETAKNLIVFSDAFYTIKEVVLHIGKEKNPRLLNKGDKYVKIIGDIYAVLEEQLKDNQKLLGELDNYKTKILNDYREARGSQQNAD